MILDSIQNAERYTALGEGFAKGLRFAQKAAAENYPDGHYEIDGEQVFANIATNTMQPLENCRYEIHEKYADIQCIVSGAERIDYTDSAGNSLAEDRRPANDIAFLAEKEPVCKAVLSAGEFALYFPFEPHKPAIAANGSAGKVKKIVVKVRCD